VLDMKHHEKVIDNYNRWISERSGIGIMGYGSQSSQDARFSVLFGLGDMNGKTVLDVGCGRGDLARIASERGVCFKEYLGVDIVPKMIDIARDMNPVPNARFEVMDVLTSKEELSYDYVIMCGTLNFNTEDTPAMARKMIKRAFEIAKTGVAFNMTSVFGDVKLRTDHTYYFDPFEVLKFCSTMTRNLVFDHTYLPHDFTVFMYKKGKYE